ncbi:MAG TPA: hypothetical protein VFE78_15230, partial [Gemmataceae bacterium]|nr:hypothetical protein [Gemmataceae bacterium]
MFTARCVLMVLGGSVFLGAPVAWLLKGRRPLAERDWLLAPFLGVAAAVLALNNGVYRQWTVARMAPWLWVAAGAGWVWMLGRLGAAGGPRPALSRLAAGARALFASCPRPVYLAAGLIFCLHGLGLLTVGAWDYLARANSDQYNYTSLAQFLVDAPYSTGWEALGQRPYLADGLKLRDDRIGVMLLQGFFAASLRTGARALFEPTILLCPTFVVLAVYALGRKLGLGRWYALATAVAAGALPGLATLHLQCFMAHSLSIPFLLINLYTLHELATAPSRGRFLGTALLLAATTALYTELAAVLLGLTAFCLAGGVLFGTLRPLTGLALLPAVPVLSVALNPRYWRFIVSIYGRIAVPTAAGDPLHYAYRLRGLACLWVNDAWAFWPGPAGAAVVAFSVVMTVLAGLGLAHLLGRCLGLVCSRSARADRGRREECLLGQAVVALAVLPLAVLLRDRQHPYQFMKLLLSVGPLLVLGVAHAWDGLPAAPRAVRALPRWGGLAALAVVALIGTGAMALATAVPKAGFRSAQDVVLEKDYRSLSDHLGTLKGYKVVLACGPGVFMNSWLSYALRRNDVWLVNPLLNDNVAVGCASPPTPTARIMPVGWQLIDLRTVPGEALLVRPAAGPMV